MFSFASCGSASQSFEIPITVPECSRIQHHYWDKTVFIGVLGRLHLAYITYYDNRSKGRYKLKMQ